MKYKANFEKYKDKASKLLSDNERVNTLLSTTKGKLKSIVESNEKLKDFSDKVYTFFRMVKAQMTGEYREMPWKSLVMITGALIYFVTPLDLIPDFIPALGLTDDLAIVVWVYNSLKEDIEKFEVWENTIEVEAVDES